MLVNKSIISSDLEPLAASDSVRQASSRMDQQKVKKLPVVDQTTQKLIGQVSYRQLERAEQDALIADLDLGEAVKIYRGQHLFEAARLMFQYEMDALPVVDEEWAFLGGVTRRQVLKELIKMFNLTEFGSVITIELSQMDFSISEIVQIVETEGAKILGLAVETPNESQPAFEVSLKLNIQDISRVAAALRRYSYTVFAESEAEVFGDDLENRAGELLKFMDM